MEFRILGPVEATRDDMTRVTLSGTKVTTVLAALLLARGRVVSDGRLADLLWGWSPPVTMGAQIYTYVSRLRKQLGGGAEIERRLPGYVIRTGGAQVDLVRFEDLAEQGRQSLQDGRYERASDCLWEALELWPGHALSNVTEHMAAVELPRLEELRTAAVENRVEADLMLGRHRELVAELTGLVADHPLRERMRAQLMTALCRNGRQAEALQIFHEGRRRLADELGVDPGAHITRTYQAVLNSELERTPALSRESALVTV
ncbi:AfsR/SARP family transcriptional regulator [Micromonospora sp. NPDC048842]|uniref:AfsR/SARP family transcriptional regulator n=1 Tax=unclassified Micromonospora TaxID=2617518 RepID=UPI0033F63F10